MSEQANDRLERVAELFERVRALPAAERAAALARTGHDAAIVDEVLSLLTFHDGDDALDRPVAIDVHDGTAEASAPERVGAYRIIRPLGEGGMGVVYLAEQEQPRRMVALKMIRPGLATGSLTRRLRQEAELLGRLHHPGIAAVYEAGATDTGFGPIPFFAMELVDGPPITRFAEDGALGARQRMALLVRVCRAVQHAHGHGVVHRDLKPANVLVDERGEPRVLDFGVARAIDPDAQTATLRTDVGQLVGTLPYMSPEQLAADGTPVDARTDVYALGVIAHELLTGRTPHDVRGRSLADAVSLIQHGSTTPLSSFDRALRGDLEVIVAKALAAEAPERYASAAAFADDLERWLADRPIVARPPSSLYLFAKFAKRHLAVVVGLTAVFVLLAASAIVAIRFAITADVAREESAWRAYRATIAAAEADLRVPDPVGAGARLATVAPERRDTWEYRHLATRLDRSRVVLEGGEEAVFSCAADPEGRWIIAGKSTGEVLAWRAPFGAPARALGRLERQVYAVCATGDGVFVAGAEDGVVHAWSETGATLWTTRLDAGVRSLVVVADGIAWAGLRDGTIVALDIATGAASATDIGGGSSVDAIVSTPSRDRFAILYRARPVRVVSAGGTVSEVVLPEATAVGWSRDGSRLAIAYREGGIGLLDASTGEEQQRLLTPPARSYVYAVSFAPGDEAFVASGNDGTVAVWRLPDPAPVMVLPGHARRVRALAWVDDARIASASDDGTVRLWDVESAFTDDRLVARPGGVSGAAVSPDGTRLATVGSGGRLRVDDVGRRIELFVSERRPGPLRSVAWSRDGETIITGANDGAVAWWDASTYATRRRVVHGDADAIVVMPAADGSVTVAFNDGTVQRFDAEGAAGVAWRAHENLLRRAATDAASGRIATAGDPEGVRIWSYGGALVRTIADEIPPSAVAWSRDGRVIHVGGTDGRIRTYEVASGALERVTEGGHATTITSLAIHPSADRLASASTDSTVRLWDLARGEEVLILRGHANPVATVVFDRAGDRLLSAGLGGEICVWRTARRE